MTDIQARPIEASDINEIDVRRLRTMQELLYDWDGTTEDHILEALAERKLRVWRVIQEGENVGNLLTRLESYSEGPWLVVFGMAGEGLFLHLPKVWKDLRMYAKANDCKRVIAYSQDERIIKWYERAVGGKRLHGLVKEL